MKIAHIELANPKGTEEIYVYLPKAPIMELPEGYKSWIRFQIEDTEELPFYGLYNVTEECGFSSYDMTREENTMQTDTADIDAETMEELTEKQRAWIADQEEQVAAEGEEYGNGTMRPLAENDIAAELTREKVYELAEWLC